MTVMSNDASSAVREYLVYDTAGPGKITGEMIADLSWTYEVAYQRNYVRWTDVTLYRVVHPRYRYMAQIVGRSVVYHTISGCHGGVTTSVGLLRRDPERYDNLVACVKCRPTELNSLKETDLASVEVPIYTLYKEPDAEGIVERLYQHTGPDKVSNLNVKLLDEASRTDEDIARAMANRRIL